MVPEPNTTNLPSTGMKWRLVEEAFGNSWYLPTLLYFFWIWSGGATRSNLSPCSSSINPVPTQCNSLSHALFYSKIPLLIDPLLDGIEGLCCELWYCSPSARAYVPVTLTHPNDSAILLDRSQLLNIWGLAWTLITSNYVCSYVVENTVVVLIRKDKLLYSSVVVC